MMEDKVLIQIGRETLDRAVKLKSAGLTTLKGSCYYISDDSPALIDVLLNALNGSEDARDGLREFLETDLVARVVDYAKL